MPARVRLTADACGDVLVTAVRTLATWLVVLVVVGLTITLPLLVPIAVGTATRERRRLAHRPGTPVPAADKTWPDGQLARWQAQWRDPTTRRDFAFLAIWLLLAPFSWLVLALAAGAALLLTSPLQVLVAGPGRISLPPGHPIASVWHTWPHVLIGLACVVVAIALALVIAPSLELVARWLLCETDLERRVSELSESRDRLSRAFEAERTRVERDLHDGTQQHLVALGMTLALADADRRDPDRLADLLGRARRQVDEAQARLREVIRGIHPAVLTDHGLEAALAEVAGPGVRLEVDVPRLVDSVEADAYFVALECLANATRHGAATSTVVTAVMEGDDLVVVVDDNGRGGAELRDGHGLQGLVDRLDVHGGTLQVTSPAGGPTTVVARIPQAVRR